EAGTARWDIGDRRYLYAAAYSDQPHGRLDQRMFDPIDRVHFLVLRVTDADAVIEFRIDRDINVFIDRCTEHGPAKVSIERRQIAAASDKTHPQWRPTDHHHCG